MYLLDIKILKNKIFKELVWSFLSKGVALILFFAFNIFLSRFLGVEKFGEWSFFLSVVSIVSVLSYFGINNASNKFIAQYSNTEFAKDVLRSSFQLRIFISLFFSVLFLILGLIFPSLLVRSEMRSLFLCSVPLVFLSGLVEYLKAAFAGLHRIKYNFVINTLEHGLKLLFLLVFVVMYGSLLSVLNSFVISLIITALVGFYLLYTNFYMNLVSKGKDFKKVILQYSYPLVFISIGSLALTEIDTVMIGLLSTNQEVGIYAIAKQIILKLPHISLAIALGTMPIFAKMTDENREELKNKFLRIVKVNSLLFIIISVFIILFSSTLIPFIFGIEYIGSVLPLQILSVYLFLLAVSIILNNFLDYVGKVKKRAIHMSLTIILNVFLNLILIPTYGAVGAAIATTVSYFPYVFLNWLEVRQTLKNSR